MPRDDGDCYEAAASYVLDVDREAVLVHGRPVLSREPYSRFGHAWVEFQVAPFNFTMVREVANGRNTVVPRSWYYSAGQIRSADNYRYTYDQLRRMIREHGHWGPWEGVEAEIE